MCKRFFKGFASVSIRMHSHTSTEIPTHSLVCWRMTEINFIEWRLSLSQRYIYIESTRLKRSMAIKVYMACHNNNIPSSIFSKTYFSCICLYRSLPRLYGKIPSVSHWWSSFRFDCYFQFERFSFVSSKTSSIWHR